MRIGVAADHAGFNLKETVKSFLEELGHEVRDFGAHEYNKEDDYPDFIIPTARAVDVGEVDRAIIFGSSGVGEAIAANRVKGVRAFPYYGDSEPLRETEKAEAIKGLIHESREDNDTNVLSIGASFVSNSEAKVVVKKWLETEFTGKDRHKRRIRKLDQ